ncbi:MAG: hypothetical protein K8F25_04080, partial [Fimbriimonadaceae bacterium]|nr:hypothetical protein [Alphaproteobacteria bacterium]
MPPLQRDNHSLALSPGKHVLLNLEFELYAGHILRSPGYPGRDRFVQAAWVQENLVREVME